MHPMELFGVLKGGARATRRQKETGQRGDDLSDMAAWKAQAKAFGYEHRSVVDRDARDRLAAPNGERLRRAYLASLPVLERQFTRRATMRASVARTAAARGLIASGVESAADIDKLTAAMREHGVRHDGKQVPLIWAKVDADAGGEFAGGTAAPGKNHHDPARRPGRGGDGLGAGRRVRQDWRVDTEPDRQGGAPRLGTGRSGLHRPARAGTASRHRRARHGRTIRCRGRRGRCGEDDAAAAPGGGLDLIGRWRGGEDGLRHRPGVAAIRPSRRGRDRARQHHGHRRAAGAGRRRLDWRWTDAASWWSTNSARLAPLRRWHCCVSRSSGAFRSWRSAMTAKARPSKPAARSRYSGGHSAKRPCPCWKAPCGSSGNGIARPH